MKKILCYFLSACLMLVSCGLFIGCNKNQDPSTPPAPSTYTITFNANSGTGTMESEQVLAGKYTLPINEFTAPTGKYFKCWSVSNVEKNVGTKIDISANTEVKAVWENIVVPTPVMLKVIYTQTSLDIGDTVNHSAVSIKCVYSDGTVEDVNIDDVTFWMETYEITDYIDDPIPYEGIYDITAKYLGLEATFRVVCLAERDGDILSLTSDTTNHVNTITVNFDRMLTEEDLYSIFSPSIENVGVRLDDDGLKLAYNEYGLVKGAEIVETGAWFRFRQPNFKHNTYEIELEVDTSDMEVGEIVRFHADEAVNWGGDFATISKSETLQRVKYVFETDNTNHIVIKVYINGKLVTSEVSGSTVENFLGGSSNAGEGICWAVYDFGSGINDYSGGAVITSMQMREIAKSN